VNAQLKPMVYAERTLDTHLIKEITAHCAAEAMEDGFILEQWIPDIARNIWIIISYNNNVVGLFQLKQVGAVTYEIHVNLLKPFRRLRYYAGFALGDWVLKNTTLNKITTQIPTTSPHVIKFAVDMGFTFEGTNRESYLKNGKICDKLLFGITRNEIKTYLGKYYA